MIDDKNDFSPERPPSKSQLKRDMIALQKLGEILVELPAHQLTKLPLETDLADAVNHARELKTREAKRRQLQYIGRLMRNIDPQPIEEAIAKIQLTDQQGKAHFHQIEKWRDKLIAEGDVQLKEFLNQFNQADTQHLRQLIRNAQQRKKGAEKELFRYLRDIIEGPA